MHAPLTQPPCRAPADPDVDLILAAGDTLCQAGDLSDQAWQVIDGAARLDQGDDGCQRLVQIVTPGDLFGTEAWFGQPHACCASALTTTRLRRLPRPAGDALHECLRATLAQQLRRGGEMVALRTGSAPERVRRLLLMLAQDGAENGALAGEVDHVLPRIKDIASIVDTSYETVSRILSSLRRSRVLQARHARFARFDAAALAHCILPAGMTRSDAATPR